MTDDRREQERRQEARRVDDRTLPYNLEAEKAVLGALLINHHVWPEAASIIEHVDFYRKPHQIIYHRMLGLLEQGVPIDFTILMDELRKNGELEDVGGAVYLSGLVDGLPHSTNIAHYAAIIRDTSRLRASIAVAEQVIDSAYSREAKPNDVIEHGVTGLLGIADAASAKVTPITDAIKKYISTLDDEKNSTQPVESGFRDLDNMIGGWQRGQLIIVAARTSVGKSSFALGTCKALARGGIPSAFVSLEMECHQLAAQVMSWESKVPADKVRRRLANDHELQTIGKAWIRMDDLPLYIVESARTLTQVAAWSRRLRDQRGVGVVAVDYLQRLGHDTGNGNGNAERRRQEVAAISLGLKRIAMDLGIIVIALSQLNRASEGRADKRPLLSDLREAGDIEQDADVAVLLFREEMHKKREDNSGIAEAIVAKNRSGPVGTVKLYFDKDLAQFRDLILS